MSSRPLENGNLKCNQWYLIFLHCNVASGELLVSLEKRCQTLHLALGGTPAANMGPVPLPVFLRERGSKFGVSFFFLARDISKENQMMTLLP